MLLSILILLVVLHWCLIESEIEQKLLFFWDIITLVAGQICTYFTRNRQIQFIQIVDEIDERIENHLGMKEKLKNESTKMQRKIFAIWIIYGISNLYYPTCQIIKNDYSSQFFDSLFRIVTWYARIFSTSFKIIYFIVFNRGFLIHLNKTKYLYFFSLISVRLEIIKTCLKDIREEQLMSKHFLVHEISQKRVNRHFTTYEKIKTLKEIYYRCWLLEDHSFQISGFFLLVYFIGYVGQLMNITFFYMKIAILENTFMVHLFDIILYFALLNVFTVSFFYVSHKIHSKGLKISGFIHEIAHNGINDAKLVEAVHLFSIQIQQQPITHINIFGIFFYDRSNINGVEWKNN